MEMEVKKPVVSSEAKYELHTIWDTYVKEEKIVKDTKGNELTGIDSKRLECIPVIKKIIGQFLEGETNVSEFKTALDSYNKRNNLWGFTSIKGQMFFNQLVKNNDNLIDELESLLKNTITEPKNFQEALSKIDKLEAFADRQYQDAEDRRKVANPGSTSYFLSYFWQIFNHVKWPIMYTSMIRSFEELGIWIQHSNQNEDYHYFYQLNEQVKKILTEYTNQPKSNWEIEHATWNYNGNPHAGSKKQLTQDNPLAVDDKEEVNIQASFKLSDYLLPKIADLREVGSNTEKSSSKRGYEYEKKVNEVFRLLDFEVESLGQGTGRNPDAILRFRQENTAFLVDAKAYGDGYSLGIDNRAILEYINHYCPKLDREGFKKIGFIIVSNSFKSDFDSFINEITWSTPIKRFVLMTSEALLYLFAYKMKENLSLDMIIEKIISCGSTIKAKDIIDEFEDV